MAVLKATSRAVRRLLHDLNAQPHGALLCLGQHRHACIPEEYCDCGKDDLCHVQHWMNLT